MLPSVPEFTTCHPGTPHWFLPFFPFSPSGCSLQQGCLRSALRCAAKVPLPLLLLGCLAARSPAQFPGLLEKARATYCAVPRSPPTSDRCRVVSPSVFRCPKLAPHHRHAAPRKPQLASSASPSLHETQPPPPLTRTPAPAPNERRCLPPVTRSLCLPCFFDLTLPFLSFPCFQLAVQPILRSRD